MLVLLALLPDLDVLGFFAGVPYTHAWGHRGVTHSLLFATLAGALVGTLWARRDRSQRASPAPFVAVGLLAGTSCASHGVLDALTDAGHGIGFFIPFDNGRYFFQWRPLHTSPLGISAFFSERGLAILSNEASYLALPCAVTAAIGLALRRRGRPHPS